MENLKNRTICFNNVQRKTAEVQFEEELNNEATQDAIRTFLLENPIELFKSIYILNDTNIICRNNANGYHLEKFNYEIISSHFLNYTYIEIIESFINKIKSNDLEEMLVGRIFDSEDFYLPLPIYESDTEYFDSWVYGDVYRITSQGNENEFTFFICTILNTISNDELEKSLNSIIPEEFYEQNEKEDLLNNIDNFRNKIDNMSNEEFKKYTEICRVFEEELAEAENQNIINESMTLIPKNTSILALTSVSGLTSNGSSDEED